MVFLSVDACKDAFLNHGVQEVMRGAAVGCVVLVDGYIHVARLGAETS